MGDNYVDLTNDDDDEEGEELIIRADLRRCVIDLVEDDTDEDENKLQQAAGSRKRKSTSNSPVLPREDSSKVANSVKPPSKNDRDGRIENETCQDNRHFILIDDDSDDERPVCWVDQSEKDKTAQSVDSQVQRNGKFRPRSSKNKRGAYKARANWTNEQAFVWNISLSQDAAEQMQERLLRESAARMRLQELAAYTTKKARETNVPKIDHPLTDVETRYPQHWLWKEPFARLGLPSHATIRMVKTQYRRLARVYHPDKSKHPNASNKFERIASAYRAISDAVEP